MPSQSERSQDALSRMFGRCRALINKSYEVESRRHDAMRELTQDFDQVMDAILLVQAIERQQALSAEQFGGWHEAEVH